MNDKEMFELLYFSGQSQCVNITTQQCAEMAVRFKELMAEEVELKTEAEKIASTRCALGCGCGCGEMCALEDDHRPPCASVSHFELSPADWKKCGASSVFGAGRTCQRYEGHRSVHRDEENATW